VKKYIVYLICIATLDVGLTPTTTQASNGFGNSFAGGFTGSLVGTSLGNAMTAPRTVYVQGDYEDDYDEAPAPRPRRTTKKHRSHKTRRENKSSPYSRPPRMGDAASDDQAIKLQELQVERARLEREAALAKTKAAEAELMLLKARKEYVSQPEDIELKGEPIPFEENQYN
jgi:hypothetical protein